MSHEEHIKGTSKQKLQNNISAFPLTFSNTRNNFMRHPKLTTLKIKKLSEFIKTFPF